MKLGLQLNAPRPRLCLSDFLPKTLPPVPPVFGHESLVLTTNWQMLGNDQVGDCVIAGGMHEHIIWRAEGGKTPPCFTDANAIHAYSAITGYNPHDPNTDQGTDMDTAAKYRRKHGFTDAHGKVYKIGGYADLNAQSLDEILYATYYLGACGIGIKFPAFAMDQFNAGKPWDVQSENSQIEGGHYIPVIGRLPNGNLLIVTWGKTQEMTPAFFETYADQGIAYLSTEMIAHGHSPEGLDLKALKAALADVTK